MSGSGPGRNAAAGALVSSSVRGMSSAMMRRCDAMPVPPANGIEAEPVIALLYLRGSAGSYPEQGIQTGAPSFVRT